MKDAAFKLLAIPYFSVLIVGILIGMGYSEYMHPLLYRNGTPITIFTDLHIVTGIHVRIIQSVTQEVAGDSYYTCSASFSRVTGDKLKNHIWENTPCTTTGKLIYR